MQKEEKCTKFVLDLIQAVKKNECIWQIKSSAHSRKDKVDAAWQEISNEVGKSEIVCRKKWKNLRTAFLRSIGEYSTAQNPLKYDKKKPHYLYDEMEFLIPHTARIGPLLHKSTTYHHATDDHVDDENQIDIKYLNSNTQDTVQSDDDTVVNDTTKCNSDPLKTIRQVKIETTIRNKRKLQNDDDNNEEDNNNGDNDEDDVNYSDDDNFSLQFSSSEQYKNKITKKDNKKLVTCNTKKKKKRFKESKSIEERSLRSFLKGCIPDILSLSHKNRLTLKRRVLEMIEELQNDN